MKERNTFKNNWVIKMGNLKIIILDLNYGLSSINELVKFVFYIYHHLLDIIVTVDVATG